MFGERTIVFFERAGIFLVALAIVAFATLALQQWSDQFRTLFLMTGKWEELIILTVFVFGLGYILRYLLRLVFRIEANVQPRRKRWR